MGLITYMRTDAVNLSEKFLTEARDLIQKTSVINTLQNQDFIKTNQRRAEAHEAIRPSDASRTPDQWSSI